MVKSACPPKRKDRGTISHVDHGGDRAFKKCKVDTDLLADELKDYVKRVGVKGAFDFGECKSMYASCAIRAKSLAQIWPYIKALLEADGRASILFLHVKTAVKNTLMAYPEARLSENSYEDDAGRSLNRPSSSRAMCES